MVIVLPAGVRGEPNFEVVLPHFYVCPGAGHIRQAEKHLRSGLSQTPVPLWHLGSPRSVEQAVLSSPSFSWVCTCVVCMCRCMSICLWAYVCTCVWRLEAILEVSVTLPLFTEAEEASQLNSEITGTIRLACSRELLAPFSWCWNYRQVAMLPWHLWDAGDLNTGPHAWTASTLSTDPCPMSLSAHFVSLRSPGLPRLSLS